MQCRFRVVSKLTGQLLKLEFVADNFFVMHHANTYETAQKLNNLIVKVRPQDTDKIEEATKLIKKHVDIEYIIQSMKKSMGSISQMAEVS